MSRFGRRPAVHNFTTIEAAICTRADAKIACGIDTPRERGTEHIFGVGNPSKSSSMSSCVVFEIITTHMANLNNLHGVAYFENGY